MVVGEACFKKKEHAGERQIFTTRLLKRYMPVICECAHGASKGYGNLLPWPDVPSEVAVMKTESGRQKSLPSLPFNPSLAKIPLTQDQVSAYSPVYSVDPCDLVSITLRFTYLTFPGQSVASDSNSTQELCLEPLFLGNQGAHFPGSARPASAAFLRIHLCPVARRLQMAPELSGGIPSFSSWISVYIFLFPATSNALDFAWCSSTQLMPSACSVCPHTLPVWHTVA